MTRLRDSSSRYTLDVYRLLIYKVYKAFLDENDDEHQDVYRTSPSLSYPEEYTAGIDYPAHNTCKSTAVVMDWIMESELVYVFSEL